MTKRTEAKKYRINIADLPKKLLEGDRVRLSDDGVDMTATILEIRRIERYPNGDISYFCKVECANGKETFATVSPGALIK